MKSSDSIAELADALVRANLVMTNPTKDKTAKVRTKTGPDYSYRYVGLDTITADMRPILQAHGLAVVQGSAPTQGGVTVTTTLLHSSGEWLSFGELFMPCAADAQSVGSAMTYARRYALCAALGIAADEDDDGAKAKKSPAAHAATKRNGPESRDSSNGGVPALASEVAGSNPAPGSQAPERAGDPSVGTDDRLLAVSAEASSDETGRVDAPGAGTPVSSETSGSPKGYGEGPKGELVDVPSASVEAGAPEAEGRSVVELWIEARELIGDTGKVVRYAAKLLGKSVSSSKMTAEDLAAVIAAKRGEAA